MNGLSNSCTGFAALLILGILCSCGDDGAGKSKARTLFVNTILGDDGNPGTFKRPVRSVSEVNFRLQQKAYNVSFAGGQVFDGTLRLDGISGSASMSVTIGSYGDEKAVINGADQEALIIHKCSFIKVENLYLTGSGRKEGNTTNGLSLVRSENCRVTDLIVEGFQKSGVDVYNSRKIEILDVLAQNNGFCGINVMGSDQDSSGNIIIRKCRAENNPGDPTRLDNHSGNGILAGVSDSVLIDHCSATGNGWDMPRQGNGPVGIWAWMSDHVTIQYCISYRNRTSMGGKDGGGFDLDGGVTNSIVQYCLSYENEGAGYGLFQYPGASDWRNNVIRYCISYNDAAVTGGAGSFFIWNGSGETGQLSECYIHNNVAYSESAPVISFEPDSDHLNFIFCNNIFIGPEEIVKGKNTGSRFAGNIWWGVSGMIPVPDFPAFDTTGPATGMNVNEHSRDRSVDPLHTGPLIPAITDPYLLNELTGYRLMPGSPVIGLGVIISSFHGVEPPTADFFGNPLPDDLAFQPGIHEIK